MNKNKYTESALAAITAALGGIPVGAGDPIEPLPPRELTDQDRFYIQAAADKRARKNLKRAAQAQK